MRYHGRHANRLPSHQRPALALLTSLQVFTLLLYACSGNSSQQPRKANSSPPAQKRATGTPHSAARPPTALPNEEPRRAAHSSATNGAPRDSSPQSSTGVRHPAPPTPLRMLRPHDPPQIYGVTLSSADVGAGDVVSGSVTTSSNVASVVASVGGVSASVPKVGVGQFGMSYRLPPFIPPSAKGTYTIVVIARNVDGVSTSRAVAITLH